MQRKFLTNLILLLFVNLLIKPFWVLGIDRSVQNVVGAADYGFYFAVFNLTFLFNILLDVGITNFNNRNIAQNNQLLNKHFSSILILRFLLALVYLIIIFACGIIIGYDTLQLKFLAILGINQFLISFILYLRSNLSGLHLFKMDSLLSVLDRLLMIIICGVLLWGNVTESRFKIEWFIYSQTIAYLLTTLVVIIIVINKAGFQKPNWNYTFFIMIVKQSIPFALLILLMSFYNRIDSVMIERMLPDGNYQAGIYASAYRLLDATNMIAFLFAALLLPIFSKMIKNKESVEDLVKLSFTLLIIPAIVIVIGSYFYRVELMDLLYHAHEGESAAVFGLLMGCFIAISVTYIFGTLLTANGNLKQLNIIAASSVIINVGLNLFLIPRYQAVGSAYASLVTQFIMAFAQIFIVWKIFRFKINYKYLTLLLLFIIGVLLINIFSKNLSHGWGNNFIIMISLSFLLALLLRLLNIKALIKIIKTEQPQNA